MKYEIVTAAASHIDPIAKRCRQADIDELWATAAILPADALRVSLETTEYARTGLIDGAPIAMGGVTQGCVWLVTTDLVERNIGIFLRESRRELEEAAQRYPILFNHVDIRNRRAIRWLKWLGFKLGDPVPYGVFRRPFYPFWYQRENQERVAA